jgi:glucarate dehydratase
VVIQDLVITPVAFHDPPLLNVWGTHEPLALRVIVQLVTDDGVVGLGEAPGGSALLARLLAVREHLVGMDVFALGRIESVVHHALGPHTGLGDRLATFAPIEVACLDAQGRLLDRPVSDLLGGAVRERVDFAAYLFYKWSHHPDPGATGSGPSDGEPDAWGAALDPDGIVAQARLLVDRYGFGSLKLKGGVYAPDIEIDTIAALRDAFPDHPLRLDPNGAWTVETSIDAARRLSGTLEYLEDPTLGIEGMSAVAAATDIPLATNMCVVGFDDLPAAVRQDAVAIVLGDHHAWGGMRRVVELGRLCRTWNLGLSMHSNSHLGISLAAMTHLAAVTPTLDYACDTHYPWNSGDDIIVGGPLPIEGGSVAVPTGAGLGVELDEERLHVLHEQYLSLGGGERDDTGYRRRIEPGFDPAVPRW